MSNIESEIGTDPLFRKLAEVATKYNIENPSLQINSGKIYKKAKKYSLIPNYFIDCLLLALEDNPKTTWKIALYIYRQICGSVLNENGRPRTYIRKRVFLDHPVRFQNELVIKGRKSYDDAFKILEEKKIIFFKEEDDTIRPNFFPLTWNLSNEIVKEKIREIIEKEIKRIDDDIL